MKMITAKDTLSLSIPERIQLMEEIWDTIASQEEAMELTQEEKRMIDERLEAWQRNPEAGSSWEKVYQRIAVNKNGV